MTTESDRRTRRSRWIPTSLLGLLAATVAASAAVGAALGYALSVGTALEDVTVLGITFVVSPTTGALYAGVAVGVFLVTLAFVFASISRLEDS
ncbi:hypothetical protein [Natronococcus occultus]|uniref:Uncharacterized protein n=1 Tax=Natronococcus occultus SP4 TaxID=694430 RepID=L0JVT0_9EURY|nr:hypothetical protein [Natronococcus occultus]AGB36861.1 hypothetical protein Natoc_1014 [Natronococcus occultus SP4]